MTRLHEIEPPERIRKAFDHHSQIPYSSLPPGAQGAITGALNRAIQAVGIEDKDEIDYSRHLVIGYLTIPLHEPLKPVSSKTLTDSQWAAFSRWHTKRMPDGVYAERPTFSEEVRWVLSRARQDLMVGQGQMPLFGLIHRWEVNGEEYKDSFEIESFRQFVLDKLPSIPNGNKLKEIIADVEN